MVFALKVRYWPEEELDFVFQVLVSHSGWKQWFPTGELWAKVSCNAIILF